MESPANSTRVREETEVHVKVGGGLVGFVFTSFGDLVDTLGVEHHRIQHSTGYGMEFIAILPGGMGVRVYTMPRTGMGGGCKKVKWHIGGESSDVVDALRDVLPPHTRCLKLDEACYMCKGLVERSKCKVPAHTMK